MGRGIICGQPGLCWDRRQGRHLRFQSIRFVSPGPLLIRNFYIYQKRRQDILSVFDENDPTAARPTTRENARELCSECMTEEWASPNSRDLTKLRIGIPQVCVPAVARSHQSIIRFNNYGYGV
jgi:hypothetical protein